jgi:hypothetical protein
MSVILDHAVVEELSATANYAESACHDGLTLKGNPRRNDGR